MKRMIWLSLLFCGVIYIWNASWWGAPQTHKLDVQAHRGLHQTFSRIGLKSDTCTATRIFNPAHSYIENTLDSMRAAIHYGATQIEMDVHPTIDGEFAVFHDWTLECRTNGTGRVRDRSWDDLKQLDIGYGYTPDGGQTFPFRGKFEGAMPRLSEVLSEFPNTGFAINIKSRSQDEARKLINYIPPDRLDSLMFVGNDIPMDKVLQLAPEARTISRQRAKSCYKSYMALGWSGYIPKVCRNTVLPVPANYRRLLWGWPYKLETRLNRVGSRTMLIGPLSDVGTTGIDRPEQLDWVPEHYSGIVFTNKVETIAPLLKTDP